MRVLSIPYFLFLAALMLAAKPFVGFHAVKKIQEGKPIRVCAKAFTKRKQEYIEDSAFDVTTIQKQLANPFLALTFLFTALLNILFPIFNKAKQVTAGILSNIHLSLSPPLHRYLLSGKLTI